ncbi:HD domain-containing protein [Rhodococcus qingshengii]
MTTTPSDPRAFRKVIRDPVHDYISVPAELLELVNHPLTQRLRRISQTSMSTAVYPSMNGRRFEHSLGAMHLALRGWDTAWMNSDTDTREKFREAVNSRFEKESPVKSEHSGNSPFDPTAFTDDEFRRTIGLGVGAAALLHDLGHPPFSHTLEEFYKTYLAWIIGSVDKGTQEEVDRIMKNHSGRDFHEQVGLILTKKIEGEDNSGDIPWDLIYAILESETNEGTWESCLHDLISGEVDVDRMDYLLRDARNSGTEFGSFDSERLLQSLELHLVKDASIDDDDPAPRWIIGFGARACSALESFIVNRYQYYRWVAFHYHAVASNRMLNLCLYYYLQTERITDENGILKNTRTDHRLNYFAMANPSTNSRNRDLASFGDDGTVLELIKTGVLTHRGPSLNDPSTNLARIRFISLSDAVLHQTANWVPMWKTDGAYREISDILQKKLYNRMGNVKFKLNEWIASHEKGSRKALIQQKRYAEIMETVSLGSDEYAPPPLAPTPRGSVPFITAGPVPFMNKIALTLFGTDAEFGGIRFLRELQAADLFTFIAKPISGHEDGFWIFATNSIVPWKIGNEGAQVFRGNIRRPLSEESGHSLHRLENMEAERSQFQCYFVSPHSRKISEKDQEEIRERFIQEYPAYVENALTKLLTY